MYAMPTILSTRSRARGGIRIERVDSRKFVYNVQILPDKIEEKGI